MCVIIAVIYSVEYFVLLQPVKRSNRHESVKRKAAERQNMSAGEMKLAKRRRKLPAAMISYIKPRRKRRLLSGSINLQSVSSVKSEVEKRPVKPARSEAAAEPAAAEFPGRFTSASIVSRYRNLDRQRSRSRQMRGGTSSVEDKTRPSTRSQTAAVMHRQLLMARMKSHEEAETKTLHQHGAEPLSEHHHYRCGLSFESQASGGNRLSEKRYAPESSATLGVKKEVSAGEETERSMRQFIRRRNLETSDTSRGKSDGVFYL